MARLQAGDIVRVVWDDHSFYFGAYLGGGPVKDAVTVGFLVRETKDYVAVAATRNPDFEDVTVIDKRMLKKVEKIG